MTTATTPNNKMLDIDLSDIIENIFIVLNQKERHIITRRFSLNNEPRQTLEEIGQKFSVTRERIRQIEKIALAKLRRTVKNTKLNIINSYAKEILKENGGVMREVDLVGTILNSLYKASSIDRNIVPLSLRIDNEIEYINRNIRLHPFWKFQEIDFSHIMKVITIGEKLMKEKSETYPEADLLSELKSHLTKIGIEATDKQIISSLSCYKGFKKVQEGWGLMTWRHINPKSLRDKGYIVLKRHKKPMHFVEIANSITDANFDRKVVTVQAVHNELIRYDQFVLIGRGLYALREWGYEDGTVSEVIEKILKKAERPMTKREIVDAVLSQRKVKKGTISLNLQKNGQFERVGRAVYQLNEKKRGKK